MGGGKLCAVEVVQLFEETELALLQVTVYFPSERRRDVDDSANPLENCVEYDDLAVVVRVSLAIVFGIGKGAHSVIVGVLRKV